MRATAVAALVTIVSGFLPFAALASDDTTWQADAGRGAQLAETLCSGCHVVGPDQTRAVTAGVPTFHAIANLPGRTEEHISNALIHPHPPMPDAQLTQHEIGDLLAYIRTMRKTEQDKPGDDTKNRPKPKYPSPS